MKVSADPDEMLCTVAFLLELCPILGHLQLTQVFYMCQGQWCSVLV